MTKTLICISGGGAIQLESATGVLMALEQLGKLKGTLSEYLACSGGAPVAALHAARLRGEAISSIIRKTPMPKLISRKCFSRYYDASGVYNLLRVRLPSAPLVNCRVAVTQAETLASCLVPATPATVVASMSIPGVFRPVKINNVNYTDGGVKNLIPTPKISQIADYDHIYLLLAPEDKSTSSSWSWFNGLFGTELKSALGLLEREITQIYEEGWHLLPKVTVIRPDVPEAATGRSLIAKMLEWSPGNCMIDHAYNFTINLLKGER